MDVWLASSLTRCFPATPARHQPAMAFDVARGERVAFQVAFRTGDAPATVRLRVGGGDGLAVRVRRVGHVPVRHAQVDTPVEDLDGVGMIPGLVPDPLFDADEIAAGRNETHSFWVTVHADVDGDPGTHPLRFTLAGGDAHEVTATVRVHPARLPSRDGMPISHFLYADALCDQYRVEPFSELFWRVFDPYLRDYTAHGMDSILVPLITPPLDGVKRPTQLLDVRRTADGYEFDWTQVVRWLRLAGQAGVATFEWSHLFTQWGAKFAARVYSGHGGSEQVLWPDATEATSPVYEDFLATLLPQLHRVLDTEGVLGSSLFHLSDEPHAAHLDTYRKASAMFRKHAPWATTIDALSDAAFAEEGLVDIPVPVIDQVPDFLQRGLTHAWTYFCCNPRGRYANRFLDTPLQKVRMIGWLLHRHQARGFLHWGYNYWYKGGTRELIDPYVVTDAHRWPGWSAGDPFMVYPGPDGPVDSLRWEVFADGLQDLALLRAVDPDAASPELASITDYAEFPRDPAWITARRGELLAELDTREA